MPENFPKCHNKLRLSRTLDRYSFWFKAQMKVCVEDGIRKLVGASNRCVYKLGDCTKKMTVYLFLRTCRDVEKEINIAHTF